MSSVGVPYAIHPSEAESELMCAALFIPIVCGLTVQVPFDLIAQTNVEGGVTGFTGHREAG